jgi:signal transduction histidine kinase
VLLHDAAVLDDPGLSDALARAARLAAANARLQADVQVQVDELGESRRRLVHAGDEERRRLERRLHETVERRLAELAGTLEHARAGTTAAGLRDVREQLDRTLDELRDLATGLHPGGIEHGGLSAALVALAERSPLPVDLRVTHVRADEEVERATWFVCSEALANMIKHSRATSVAISVGERAGRLLVEVTDNGVGGADLGGGSGLAGLADRAEALGGTLALDSPLGGGTRVTVELPLRVQAP